jgi:hypothetical protein
VRVHRLVQTITRARLTPEAVARWRREAAVLAEAAVPTDPEASTAWPACAVRTVPTINGCFVSLPI